MKKTYKIIPSLFKGLAVSSLVFGLAACSDSSSNASDDSNESGKKYGFSFMVENSQFIGTASISADQKKVVDDFVEIPNKGGFQYFNGSLYALYVEDMNSTLVRYELDKDNNMSDKPAATAHMLS